MITALLIVGLILAILAAVLKNWILLAIAVIIGFAALLIPKSVSVSSINQPINQHAYTKIEARPTSR